MLLLAAVLPFAAAQSDAPKNERYRDQAPLYSTTPAGRDAAQAAESGGEDRGDLAEEFERIYQDLDAPRVAIFWAHELSDRPTDRVEGVTRVQEQTASIQGKDGEGEVDIETGVERRTHLEGRRPDTARHWLPPDVAAQVRTAFESRLLNAGVELIDRNVAIRLQAAATPEGHDFQRLELDAVRDRSDWIVEVLSIDRNARDPNFKVRVRRISDGRLLASFTDAGMRPAGDGASQWLPAETGFEKVDVETSEDKHRRNGDWLAVEMMRRVSASVVGARGE